MVVTAVRGALGFLSRLPVGRDEPAWEAFQSTPAAFPVAGYVIGGLIAASLLLPFPPPTAALAFVAAVYAVTGVNHVDGVVDLGDAAVVHGGRERRRDVLTDTTVGVGGVLAAAVVVLGLGTAGLALADLPAATAASLVVAAEVGAKAGMAAVACLGSPTHDGLGAAVATPAGARSLPVPVVVAAPVAALTWPDPTAAAALVCGGVVAVGVLAWARHRLGGVNGDVLGATNEVVRVAALHAGVVAWTHF